MKTQEALDKFLLQTANPSTRQSYNSRLRHFAIEHPELPADTATIEKFLQARHETPAHRGNVYQALQSFYKFIQTTEGIPSPVPSKGKVGRPSKRLQKSTQRALTSPSETTSRLISEPDKLLQGGVFRCEVHIYLHTGRRSVVSR